MSATLFDNEIRITQSNEVILNAKLLDEEVEQYKREIEEYGQEVARANLLISVTKRLIGAKRIQISYFKSKKK